MRRIILHVDPGPEPNDPRVVVHVSTDPPLPDALGGLGMLYLPLPWVRVLRVLEPAFSILDVEFSLDWRGLPLEVLPDPRIAQIARLVRKAVHLFT